MVTINGCEVPSCADLAKRLAEFGDTPLYSGAGWYVVVGFCKRIEGTQIAVAPCPPIGHSAKDHRNAIGGV